MNYIIIFKDNEQLKKVGIDISNLTLPVKIDDATYAYLFDDSQTCDETIAFVREEKIELEGNTFYVVLHNRTQSDFKAIFKETFGQNVITQSHTPGDFYFTIIPKLIDSSATFEEIKKFFPNKKLNAALEFLHQSLGGTPANDNILTIGDEKFNLEKEVYKDKSLKNWIKELAGKTGDKYNLALADVRDALLENAK